MTEQDSRTAEEVAGRIRKLIGLAEKRWPYDDIANVLRAWRPSTDEITIEDDSDD